MAAGEEHTTGMTSGELLDRVRSKHAEVERYVEVNSQRRRLLVNLAVIAGAVAALLTAPAAVGGKPFTDWLRTYSILRLPRGNSCACSRA